MRKGRKHLTDDIRNNVISFRTTNEEKAILLELMKKNDMNKGELLMHLLNKEYYGKVEY